MTGSHDAILVGLSIVIAVLASFAALDLASRMRAAKGPVRRLWLTAAAITLGGGIWSMHFVAMLAFVMPGMAMSYDLGLTLLSLFLAVLCTGVGFSIMNRGGGAVRLGGAGLLMGLGMVAMHHVGMAAMMMDADILYDPLWVALSGAIAIGAAVAALSLTSREQYSGRQLTAALLMGAAISGMHYVGMRGVIFIMHDHADAALAQSSVSPSILAAWVSALTLLILVLALGAATIDRRLAAAARREARVALRLRLAEAIRDATPEKALRETAALLGQHFGVERVGYGELDATQGQFDYRICWTDGSVPIVLGHYPLSNFGGRIVALLTSGETVVVADLLADAMSDGLHPPRNFSGIDTQAILIVPFVHDGRLQSVLYLNSRNPRHWTSDEVMFVEEIAERTRQIIARADAETKLRQLNETLEQRVREAVAEREVLAAVVDNTSASVMVCDPDLNIVALNRTQQQEFQRIYGRPCRIGENLLELLSADPRHRNKIHAQWLRALDGETFVIVDEFGDVAYVQAHYEVHFHPMRDASARIIGAFLTAYDVSARVQAQRDLESAQEALRQSQKMEAMGQLTGGVAHDFNNLLTPILGALDMLQRRGVGTEREQRLIAGAFQSADRAKVLVQRLLAFARRQPLQAVPVEVGKLVAGMADLVASTTGPQIRVSVDAADDLPHARADVNQLEMALLNLSVNARDAMPDGGTLRITARAEHLGADRGALKAGDYVCLSVADTGIGMDDATMARAIEPFFSTKGIGRGTGLGLSMVHGLASQLGGALTISSRPGVGTNIELWLPQSASEIDAGPAVMPQPRALKRGTALLVDDEEYVRMSTADMLGDLGYAVVEAASAEEAMLLVEKGARFDILLTDHLMPGMTGTELAKRVRIARPELPVLLVSGYAEIEGIAADLPRLTKPFRKDELAMSLADL
ncbi:ATP-binding protein [Sphingobium sufflavum]|uniref:MHYT domain-containing protein n=1 Tax=Sphingobium sufflavum TaxID=1129547 RepID=UPI001F26AA74|nr:MHYT domain-containing protein [Sphingobium sufflavum]MCE7797098.1 ATP-binding protein [Sphingobium sufflavum]